MELTNIFAKIVVNIAKLAQALRKMNAYLANQAISLKKLIKPMDIV